MHQPNEASTATRNVAELRAAFADCGAVLGVWGEKKNYGRTYMGMIRSTYLLDPEGRILRIWPKVRVKGHAEEVLEAVRSA